eukprot:50710-Rhodomonas_salina.1
MSMLQRTSRCAGRSSTDPRPRTTAALVRVRQLALKGTGPYLKLEALHMGHCRHAVDLVVAALPRSVPGMP